MRLSTFTHPRSTGVVITLLVVAVSTFAGCQNGASDQTVTQSTSTSEAQDSFAHESSSQDHPDPEVSSSEASAADTSASGSIPQGASPVAVTVLTAAQELGYCDDDWISDTEAWHTFDELPTPTEAWRCSAMTTDPLISFARFTDDAEVSAYYTKALAELERRGQLFITETSKMLKVGDGVVVGANDQVLGGTDLAALEEIQKRVGGEIVPIFDLAG